ELETITALHPKLELRLLLENADEHGSARRQSTERILHVVETAICIDVLGVGGSEAGQKPCGHQVEAHKAPPGMHGLSRLRCRRPFTIGAQGDRKDRTLADRCDRWP